MPTISKPAAIYPCWSLIYSLIIKAFVRKENLRLMLTTSSKVNFSSTFSFLIVKVNTLDICV